MTAQDEKTNIFRKAHSARKIPAIPQGNFVAARFAVGSCLSLQRRSSLVSNSSEYSESCGGERSEGRRNADSPLRSKGRLDSAASRETVFLLNNLFLTAFMLTVLVGTIFPLVAEAVRGVKK